jgi:MOSC domain-containing protein YiiM
LNLNGDGQGDRAGHGGEQRGVFVYQIESYRYWQEQLRSDFVHGQFGENFTIEGLPDDAVCIGDRYQIGSALFEVTQPRVTCYRVGIRMNEPRMPALLTSSGRPGFYFRVLREGEVGAGDEIVKIGEAKDHMTAAEINAFLYLPDHSRDQLARALQIEALSPGWRASFEALLQSQKPGNAGLMPAAAAHPAAPGFRQLAVTSVDQESADVLSLTMQSPNGQPLPMAPPGQYVVLRLQRTGEGPTLFRSTRFRGRSLRIAIELASRLSRMVQPEPTCGTTFNQVMFSTSVPRAEVSFCKPVSGLWCCSARESGLRLFSRCCTRWRRLDRYGQSCGSTRLAIGSTIHSLPKSAASCSHNRMPAVMFVTAGLARATGWGRISTRPVTCRSSKRSASHETRMSTCGPTRFMADMKRALAAWGLAPERIHVEIFNGSESLTPGVVGMVTKAPHLPTDYTNTGLLVSFARSGIAAHGTPRPTRAFWSWLKRATFRSVGRAGLVFVIAVKVAWFPQKSSMDQSRSISLPKATFSFAAHNRSVT